MRGYILSLSIFILPLPAASPVHYYHYLQGRYPTGAFGRASATSSTRTTTAAEPAYFTGPLHFAPPAQPASVLPSSTHSTSDSTSLPLPEGTPQSRLSALAASGKKPGYGWVDDDDIKKKTKKGSIDKTHDSHLLKNVPANISSSSNNSSSRSSSSSSNDGSSSSSSVKSKGRSKSVEVGAGEEVEVRRSSAGKKKRRTTETSDDSSRDPTPNRTTGKRTTSKESKTKEESPSAEGEEEGEEAKCPVCDRVITAGETAMSRHVEW